MRATAVLALVILCGCASSGSPETAPNAGQYVNPTGVGRGMFIQPSNMTNVVSIPATIDQVWAVLAAAYDSVGIPLSDLDARARALGNGGMKVRRVLGGVRLSQYLDCGAAQLGPSADSYEVRMSVMTHLKSGDPGNTTMITSVEAAARPIQFNEKGTQCTSKGALEKRIHEMVTTALQRTK